jgi:hypothetical protein
MPFIRGRYHMNPVLGEALEAAREAEAALLELEQQAQQNGNDGDGGDGEAAVAGGSQQQQGGKGSAHQRIHRVEIEAGEMVPPHSGRAERGFVARVHRRPADGAADEQDEFAASPAHLFLAHNSSASRPARVAPSQAETHVFSDHRDLVNFLRDELARDCKK